MTVAQCIVLVLSLLVLPAALADDKPDTSKVLTLMGLETFGHACPVGGEVLTAAHVAYQPHSYVPRSFSWEDNRNHWGTAKGQTKDPHRDLATLKIEGGTPDFYQRSWALPVEGSKVYWVQFKDDDLRPERKDAKVLYYRAGYVFFDEYPENGASGSCLFDEAGRVVGIVVWHIGTRKRSGAATLIVDWP